MIQVPCTCSRSSVPATAVPDGLPALDRLLIDDPKPDPLLLLASAPEPLDDLFSREPRTATSATIPASSTMPAPPPIRPHSSQGFRPRSSAATGSVASRRAERAAGRWLGRDSVSVDSIRVPCGAGDAGGGGTGMLMALRPA